MPTLENRSRAFTPLRQGLNFFVDGVDGSDLNSGLYQGQAVKTFARAIVLMLARIAEGQRVTGLHVEPGDYAENVVFPRGIGRITVTGRADPAASPSRRSAPTPTPSRSTATTCAWRTLVARARAPERAWS